MAVKTQLYLCNIQGVSVCTNVSTQLAETFVHTPTPCILHKHSCVLTAILYEFVYLVLRYTTGMALLKT